MCTAHGLQGGLHGGASLCRKRRWFAVTPDYTMYYYANTGDRQPKGEMHLQSYEVRPDCFKGEKDLCIELYHATRRCFYVFADSREDYEQWIPILKEVCRKSRFLLHPDPLRRRAFDVACAYHHTVPPHKPHAHACILVHDTSRKLTAMAAQRHPVAETQRMMEDDTDRLPEVSEADALVELICDRCALYAPLITTREARELVAGLSLCYGYGSCAPCCPILKLLLPSPFCAS